MRSYNHYCGLAKALDVVGDRWTLLVVRELMMLGAARYTDLQNGLPGIATNMLATRLRELEDAGIVVREEAPPPMAATLFRLTSRGEALEPVISALGRWAGPLLGECTPENEFRDYWLSLPVRLYLADRSPADEPIAIKVFMRDAKTPMVIETVGNGDVRARVGNADPADLEISGLPHLVIGLLARRLTVAAARARGLSVRGNHAVLERIGPRFN